jgi:hypothetical protein
MTSPSQLAIRACAGAPAMAVLAVLADVARGVKFGAPCNHGGGGTRGLTTADGIDWLSLAARTDAELRISLVFRCWRGLFVGKAKKSCRYGDMGWIAIRLIGERP